MSYSGKAGWSRLLSTGRTPDRAALLAEHLYLNLKEEPRVKRMGLGLGFGSS